MSASVWAPGQQVTTINAFFLNVKDFGAAGDGSTDDTAAFLAAFLYLKSVGGGILYVPKGVYIISQGTTLNGYANIRVVGAGVGATTLKSTVPTGTPIAGGSVFWLFTSPVDISFEQITLDANNIIPTALSVHMLGCSQGNGFVVKDSEFINGGRLGFVYNGVNRVRVENCYFSRSASTGTYANAAIMGYAGAGNTVTDVYISNNLLTNWGMLLTGFNVLVSDNIIKGYAYGNGITISADAYTFAPKISGNTCRDSSGLDMNASSPSGIECWAPYAIITGNFCYNNAGSGIRVGGAYSVVDGNCCINNGNYNNLGSGVSIVGITGYPVPNNLVISNNSMLDTGTGYQAYGYNELTDFGSQFAGTRIIGNNSSGNSVANYRISTFSQPAQFEGYVLENVASYNPPSMANNTSNNTLQITVGGAQLGDFAEAACDIDLLGLTLSAQVLATNLVRVVITNNTGVTVDLVTAFFRVRVKQRRPTPS